MKRLLQLTLVLLITAGLTTVANAQQTASDNITASATIQSSVTLTGTQNLDFGTVPSGSATPIAYDEANAGIFTVQGNESVSLSFSLPNNLANNSSSTTMPINFGSTDAAWSDDGTNYNVFDPSGSADIDLWDSSVSSDGNVSVYIGGEVNPAANQEAGTYEGTIVLTASYN